MKIPKTMVVTVALCVVLVTGAFLLWLYNHDAGLIPEESYASYAEAVTFLEIGDYHGSIRAMRDALIPVEAMADSPQKFSLKANIEYNIAATTNLSGDFVHAIQLFKQIVANPGYRPITRAKSVQYMAEMILGETDVARRAEIQKEVFKDSPYASMSASNDDGLSARKLAEYASSLYPIALSELRIAEWYAKDILFNKLSTTTSPGTEHIALVNEKLLSAGADIAVTEGLSTAKNEVPTLQMRKAVVIDGLAQLGVVPLTTADSAYKEALGTYVTYKKKPGSDAMVRFYYASFLSSAYGATRSTEVHELIQPIYDGVVDLSGSYAVKYLVSLSTAVSTTSPRTTRESNKLRARRVALIDPGFKAFLVALDWKEVEFSSTSR